METWMIVVIVVIVVALVAIYYKFLRPEESAPQLPEAEEPKALPKKPQEREKPKVSAKPKEKTKTAEEKKPTPSEKPEPEAKEPTESADEPAQAQEAPKEEVEEPAPVVAQEVAPTKVKGRGRDVLGLRKGLSKSRQGIFGRLAKLITGRKEIDPGLVDEIEEVLLTSDVGVNTTSAILERIREGLKKQELDDEDKVWEALREQAQQILTVGEGGLTLRTKPAVVLMVGVNGSGKTTTIGKLATQLKADGRTVLLAAGDTFRAAAVQQLEVWGERVGCEVVKGKDGADPGSVVFDAIRRASEVGADVVLADTAGRLHTKTPLMDELKKVVRTMGKAMEGAPHEVMLVIDATNGQNALAQSRQFAEALDLSGIILTKLDGTAKGGVILAISDEMKIPVRYIGIGERPDDLRKFDAEEFVEAMLGDKGADDAEAA